MLVSGSSARACLVSMAHPRAIAITDAAARADETVSTILCMVDTFKLVASDRQEHAPAAAVRAPRPEWIRTNTHALIRSKSLWLRARFRDQPHDPQRNRRLARAVGEDRQLTGELSWGSRLNAHDELTDAPQGDLQRQILRGKTSVWAAGPRGSHHFDRPP